jgi:hypothetical protein
MMKNYRVWVRVAILAMGEAAMGCSAAPTDISTSGRITVGEETVSPKGNPTPVAVATAVAVAPATAPSGTDPAAPAANPTGELPVCGPSIGWSSGLWTLIACPPNAPGVEPETTCGINQDASLISAFAPAGGALDSNDVATMNNAEPGGDGVCGGAGSNQLVITVTSYPTPTHQ